MTFFWRHSSTLLALCLLQATTIHAASDKEKLADQDLDRLFRLSRFRKAQEQVENRHDSDPTETNVALGVVQAASLHQQQDDDDGIFETLRHSLPPEMSFQTESTTAPTPVFVPLGMPSSSVDTVRPTPSSTTDSSSSSTCVYAFVYCGDAIPSVCLDTSGTMVTDNSDMPLPSSGWSLDLSQVDLSGGQKLVCQLLGGAQGCDIATATVLGTVDITDTSIAYSVTPGYGSVGYHAYVGPCLMSDGGDGSVCSTYTPYEVSTYPLSTGTISSTDSFVFDVTNQGSYTTPTWPSYNTFSISSHGSPVYVTAHAQVCVNSGDDVPTPMPDFTTEEPTMPPAITTNSMPPFAFVYPTSGGVDTSQPSNFDFVAPTPLVPGTITMQPTDESLPVTAGPSFDFMSPTAATAMPSLMQTFPTIDTQPPVFQEQGTPSPTLVPAAIDSSAPTPAATTPLVPPTTAAPVFQEQGTPTFVPEAIDSSAPTPAATTPLFPPTTTTTTAAPVVTTLAPTVASTCVNAFAYCGEELSVCMDTVQGVVPGALDSSGWSINMTNIDLSQGPLQCQIIAGATQGCALNAEEGAFVAGVVQITDTSITFQTKQEWAGASFQTYVGSCLMSDGGAGVSMFGECSDAYTPYDVSNYPLSSGTLEPLATNFVFDTSNQGDNTSPAWGDYQTFAVSSHGVPVYLTAHVEICYCTDDDDSHNNGVAPTPTMSRLTMMPTKLPTSVPLGTPSVSTPSATTTPPPFDWTFPPDSGTITGVDTNSPTSSSIITPTVSPGTLTVPPVVNVPTADEPGIDTASPTSSSIVTPTVSPGTLTVPPVVNVPTADEPGTDTASPTSSSIVTPTVSPGTLTLPPVVNVPTAVDSVVPTIVTTGIPTVSPRITEVTTVPSVATTSTPTNAVSRGVPTVMPVDEGMTVISSVPSAVTTSTPTVAVSRGVPTSIPVDEGNQVSSVPSAVTTSTPTVVTTGVPTVSPGITEVTNVPTVATTSTPTIAVSRGVPTVMPVDEGVPVISSLPSAVTTSTPTVAVSRGVPTAIPVDEGVPTAPLSEVPSPATSEPTPVFGTDFTPGLSQYPTMGDSTELPTLPQPLPTIVTEPPFAEQGSQTPASPVPTSLQPSTAEICMNAFVYCGEEISGCFDSVAGVVPSVSTVSSGWSINLSNVNFTSGPLQCQLIAGAQNCDANSEDSTILGLVEITDTSITYFTKQEWAGTSFQTYIGTCVMSDGGAGVGMNGECSDAFTPYDVLKYPLSSGFIEEPATNFVFDLSNQVGLTTPTWGSYETFGVSSHGQPVYLSAHAEICNCPEPEHTSAPVETPSVFVEVEAPTKNPSPAPRLTPSPTALRKTNVPSVAPSAMAMRTRAPASSAPYVAPVPTATPFIDATPTRSPVVAAPALSPEEPAHSLEEPAHSLGKCVSAFVYCGEEISTCFNDFEGVDVSADVSGWSINLSLTSYETEALQCQVYGSVPSCDVTADEAELLGIVEITSSSVTWLLRAEYASTSFQLYAGSCPMSDGGAAFQSDSSECLAPVPYDIESYPLTRNALRFPKTKYFFDLDKQQKVTSPGWRKGDGSIYETFDLTNHGDVVYLSAHAEICECVDEAIDTAPPTESPTASPTSSPTVAPTSSTGELGTTVEGSNCEDAYVWCPDRSMCFLDSDFNCYTDTKRGVWGWNIEYNGDVVDDCVLVLGATGCDLETGVVIGSASISSEGFTVTVNAVGYSDSQLEYNFYAGQCRGSDGGQNVDLGICIADTISRKAHEPDEFPLTSGLVSSTTFTFDDSLTPRSEWGSEAYSVFPIGSEDRQYLTGHVKVCQG